MPRVLPRHSRPARYFGQALTEQRCPQTLIEALVVVGIVAGLCAIAFLWGSSLREDRTRRAESMLSNAKETVLYLESLAARGMHRNRGADESTESFVREYIVRLEAKCRHH